jgi:hypothetical protein
VKRARKASKFVQLAASIGVLFALDDRGQVWERTLRGWRRMPMARVATTRRVNDKLETLVARVAEEDPFKLRGKS